MVFASRINYIIENLEYDFEDMDEELEKLGLEWVCDAFVDEGDFDTFVGYNLKGKGGKRQLLKTPELIKEVEDKLKKLFPKEEPDFYVGEMSC